ncbi:CDP-diacylglycerol--serine O-phosphatidyltransferase PssA [Gottschalkia purinilytica]|uniref:CDP-diacylglycerol--serine O-phosphatidyltransferase n=1 Tax=Gottschalkia purinilytica TaxID=1503 RepID=A0A0L0WFB4_GOTPU|nr:CDP-diacylglycerol--serine O-phosphatidyltransferase [Gottschalkia purinilytica]KNF10159.1 CDP-diacylglycerol--serine O-phosphatidyltransferase PssA [Gottschalkia purinilytica]
MEIKSKLPNLFTLLNLSLGVLAIINMFHNEYYLSSLLIILATLLDRFDGMLARKFNATSSLGKELDSLCDLISFGIAPSILIWNIKLVSLGSIGTLITILYAVSGAYRLARYNTTTFEGVYVGIPITLAGGLVSIISLYSIKYKFNIYALAILLLFLSYAMISTKIRLKKR